MSERIAAAKDAMRRSSAKRMQPSSAPAHPLSGTITHSKYHLVHRNPTGRKLRSDPGRRKDSHYGFQSSSAGFISDSVKYSTDDDNDDMLISDLCKKVKLNQESSVGDDGEPSHILIKDLRARRVYSPQSVGESFSNSSQNVDPKELRVGSSRRDQEKVDSGPGPASTVENNGSVEKVSKRDNLGERLPSEGRSKYETNSTSSSIAKEYQSEKGLYSDGALDPINEETESPVVGFPYKAQNLDYANHESVAKGKQLQYVNDCHDGRGTLERTDNLNEVPKLTTPPDIETCGNIKVDEDGGKQVEGIRVKDTQLTGNTEENAEEPFCPKADNKNDSVLKSKYVLRPRLQRKLFKTPGSVSYRRLLPFIMNMTKDGSGTSTLGYCQNDEKVIDAKQFQVPLSSQSQEASKDQLKTDSCPANDTVESRVLVDNNDLSGGNESKLTSYQDLPESPMQLSAKEAAHDCSFVPSVNEHTGNVEVSFKCSSSTKADLAVDVHCNRDVANALHNDDFKQDLKHSNVHGDNGEAIDDGDSSKKICALNQECLSPPDPDICGDHKNTPGTDHFNTMDLTRNAQANAGEGSCPNATKGKDNVLKSKSVLKQCLQRKFFKTPGSISYKRLLPFLKDIAKDDCGSLKLGHHQKYERGMFAKRSQLPLLFRSQEATIDEPKTDISPMHDTVDELNTVKDIKSVDPANELSYSSQPIMTSSQVLPEFPMQSNAKEVDQECVSAPSVMRDGSEPKTTLVLNPCLQIEFLKHSGSFSYRRLLPFLKNITKDNSCANDHNPKPEKCLDQTTPPNSALDYQVTHRNDPNGRVIPMEHCTGNSAAEQKVLPGPDDSSNNSSPKVIASANIPESQSSHDSFKLFQLQDERVLLNGDSNLESSPDLPISVARIDSPIIPSSPIINEVITGENAPSASHQLSVYTEAKGDSSSNGETPLNADGCCQKFQTKALKQYTIPTVGFRKGILKRNPRGCRGLCSCLNCASFRLHAERAFEFSRNQFLDAEEVALDLMKELSHLRNMLERRTDGANNHSVLDENSVKEACMKAFAAEQLARDRLSQMNDDLNIHCRITCSEQPRVKFANYIEEKVISPGRLFRQK